MQSKVSMGTSAALTAWAVFIAAGAALAAEQAPATAPAAATTITAASAPATSPADVANTVAEAAATASAPAGEPIDAAHQAAAGKLIDGGIAFLLSQRQDNGGWSLGKGANEPAVTAMVLKALIQQKDFPGREEILQRGFDLMLKYRQKDGGIYDPKQGLANYTTSLAVMAMVALEDPQYNGKIRQAVEFLKGEQIAPGSQSPDGKKVTEDSPFMGGVSYGEHGRPDLSNVGMWMDALHDAGVAADDPAIQRALVFVSRTQNRSESNPLPWAKGGANDGGFIYAPGLQSEPAEGETKVKAPEDEKDLRSYGSMTYVGFKSLLYAGLGRDDGRVKAAFEWIRRYWRLDSNPNMPAAQSLEGLYYYYHAYAKALRAWGEPVITDAQGHGHNWRQELIDVLAQRVAADGSWVNQASRWAEASPVLVTAYAVLALQETLQK